LFRNSAFKRATDDRFFISIEAGDPIFDSTGTRELLESISGQPVEEIEDVQ